MERKRNPVKTITWKDITSLAEEVAVLLCKINTNRHLIAKASNTENNTENQEGKSKGMKDDIPGHHFRIHPLRKASTGVIRHHYRADIIRDGRRQRSCRQGQGGSHHHVPKARPPRSLTPL